MSDGTISIVTTRTLDTGVVAQGPVPVSAANPVPTKGTDGGVITDGVTAPVSLTTGAVTVASGDITFSAASQDVVIDMGGFAAIALTLAGTWVGGIQVLWSNKTAGPWKNGLIDTSNAGTSGALPLLTIGSNDQFVAAKMGRYARILMSAYTSGSPVVTPVLLRDPALSREAYVNNNTASPIPTVPTVNAGAGGNTAPTRLVSSAASNNVTTVRGTPARIWSIIGRNTAAADKFLKLYNKSGPTVGTDVPWATFTLPPGGFAFEPPGGLYLNTAFSFAITGGVADNDNTSIAAGDITGLNIFLQ